MRAGRPSNGMCSRASLIQLVTMLVVRKHFEQQVVDARDVALLAGQSHPAEGADGAGKERTQIGLGEDRDVEGVGNAALARLGADEVAVVEDFRALLLKLEHRRDVLDDRGAACGHQLALAVVDAAISPDRRVMPFGT